MGFFDFIRGKGAAESASGDTLTAFAEGTVVPMEQIADPVFSDGIMGICCGIEPDVGRVYAPADGTVSQLTDTLHAVCIQSAEMELLIHAGLDTVKMNGDGFTNTVKEGQTVKKGDLLLTMDLEKVRAAGCPATVILAVTNSDDYASVKLVADGQVRVGDSLLRVKK